eukprot:COSAG02_NODE_139_length_34376_cov_233.853663_19_plen_157_part_00
MLGTRQCREWTQRLPQRAIQESGDDPQVRPSWRAVLLSIVASPMNYRASQQRLSSRFLSCQPASWCVSVHAVLRHQDRHGTVTAVPKGGSFPTGRRIPGFGIGHACPVGTLLVWCMLDWRLIRSMSSTFNQIASKPDYCTFQTRYCTRSTQVLVGQ